MKGVLREEVPLSHSSLFTFFSLKTNGTDFNL